ncbi:transcription factor IIIB 90 kDa subunit, partial [Dendroctonus ponderosae]
FDSDPCLYILRFASKLEFGAKTQQVTNTALRLVQRMKRDSIHSGRRPSGLCGAALLIAARLHEFNRSIPDIVKVVKIHESTMRKRLTEFGDTPSSSLTLEEFMTVDLEEEQDPPSFKAARKKDKERLMKVMEEESDQFNDLQKTIEVQLEQIKTKSNKLPVFRNEKNLEQSDAEKFIHESTMSVIQEIIEENEDAPNCSFPVELGPNIESIGLPNSLEDTCNALPRRENEIELNLDFDDIDDEELDTYILTEAESETKHTLWTEINADYLQKQKDKEEQLKKETEEGKPEKKPRKRPTKRTRIGPANSAGEAIERIIHEKKISSKINYDVLKNLNISPSDDTPTPNEESATGLDSAKRLKYSSDIIHEQTPKRAPRGKQLKDVGLPFIESSTSPPAEKDVKRDLKSKHKESDAQVVEEEDTTDFYDDQEEKPDESANQLGVLHMLKQYHEEENDGDDYQYDDYGYEGDY